MCGDGTGDPAGVSRTNMDDNTQVDIRAIPPPPTGSETVAVEDMPELV